MSDIIIPDAYTKTFSKGFKHQAQKKMTRMKQYAVVTTGITGESYTSNTIEPESMEETTGQRFPKTVLSEIGGEIRNMFPRTFRKAKGQAWNDGILLGETVLPGSQIFESLTAAYARTCDTVFIEGITGTNRVGPNGGENEELHASNIVPVDYVRTGSAVNSNLTTGKLRYIKRLFEELEFYGQDQKEAGAKICVAINAAMKDALLDDDKISDADKSRFNKFDDGDLVYWMGMYFIREEGLPVSSSNPLVKAATAWISNQVEFGEWANLRTAIKERPDLDDAIQYSAKGMVGAMRLQRRAVATAWCQTDLLPA